MKNVSIIIPNYNGRNLLQKNLSSVIEAMTDFDELIIIDDQSSDDSVSFLISKYQLKEIENHDQYTHYQNKNIFLIVNKRNLKFGQNVNRAAKFAQKELLFLLNSDVKISEDTLLVLKESFSHTQNVFAVGCLEKDGQQLSGKNKLWFEQGIFRHSKADNFDPGPTAWVSGGSGMFDRLKFLELGGFDRNFSPAYWEDIDLSLRARKRGWLILFEPKALVWHEHESTHSKIFSPQEVQKMSWKNGDYFTQKHASLYQLIWFWFYFPLRQYQRWKISALQNQPEIHQD